MTNPPPKAHRPAAASTPESEKAWASALELFARRRLYEGKNAAQVKKLIEMLRVDADIHYSDADTAERTGSPHGRISLTARAMNLISKLNRAAFHPDLVPAKSKARLLAIASTPAIMFPALDRRDGYIPDLRRFACTIVSIAAEHQRQLDLMHASVKKMRTKKTGRMPLVSMHELLKFADSMKTGDADLARRLVAAGIASEGSYTDESDPFEQWRTVIKAARGRKRRRAK